MDMSILVLAFLYGGVQAVCLLVAGRLGKAICVPLALLVFLATTGQMFYVWVSAERLLIRLGIPYGSRHGLAWRVWEDLGFYAPAALALVLAVWLSLEVYYRCSKCGYNLTGNVSGICPECGMVVPGRADPTSGAGV